MTDLITNTCSPHFWSCWVEAVKESVCGEGCFLTQGSHLAGSPHRGGAKEFLRSFLIESYWTALHITKISTSKNLTVRVVFWPKFGSKQHFFFSAAKIKASPYRFRRKMIQYFYFLSIVLSKTTKSLFPERYHLWLIVITGLVTGWTRVFSQPCEWEHVTLPS